MIFSAMQEDWQKLYKNLTPYTGNKMQANLLHRTLVEVKQLISKPENWTQYCRARDRYGVSCPASGTDAVSFCLIGAIERVVPTWQIREEIIASIRDLWLVKVKAHITDYNDSHSHMEVMVKLDEFIALAKEEINQ